ncbi:MAG: protein-tyrosine phosphatase [Candidatus Azotimanducaceae bacterium]|jgi:protein-tyrosine phosphatase
MTRDPRFIPIKGSLNFRDFGGYQTTNGGTIKKGKLFRCGMLTGIRGAGKDDFTALDIGVICDLRRLDEVEGAPTPAEAPFDVRVHIPIAPGSSMDLRASFSNPAMSTQDRINYMCEITREIARDHVAEYKLLVEHLLNTENGFLLHCTAGKDRTGFGAAVILSALGVPEDHIFDDYLLTNAATELLEMMKPSFEQNYGSTVTDDDMKAIAGVQRGYLEAAIQTIDQDFGGMAGYLEEIGLGESSAVELRRRLVDKA